MRTVSRVDPERGRESAFLSTHTRDTLLQFQVPTMLHKTRNEQHTVWDCRARSSQLDEHGQDEVHRQLSTSRGFSLLSANSLGHVPWLILIWPLELI